MDNEKIFLDFKIQHNIRRFIKVGIAIIIIIAIIIKALLTILKKHFEIWFLVGGINEQTVNYWLSAIILLNLMFFALLLIHKVYLKIISVIVGIIVLLFYNFLFSFDNSNQQYFYFNSPNNGNTLIVEENAWLLGGWSNFYVKKNIFFIKNLKQSISTDDGYRPFTSGDYKLLWVDNNTVELSYGFGQGNVKKSKTIKLK